DLYRAYVGRIYAYVRSQLGSAADAEDVTSQVFMKAYEAYRRYEPRHETPSAWLFQIARNAALDHHRRFGRQAKMERALAREPQPSADPVVVAQERILYGELMSALAGLPERQRQVIGLRHSGLSFQEVGRLMACSEDAAKMLYHRSLRALRAALPQDAPASREGD
ncbi:MAG TPA: sigma-70 family RNA polymerase sigma factor, partial [Candidatus Eisenbacteria bacterium]|nr:sigma-70 family RNA polymerase sigma factor [Candidatus Eisenbacteria bacterium]